jgi:hypothetical protein
VVLEERTARGGIPFPQQVENVRTALLKPR